MTLIDRLLLEQADGAGSGGADADSSGNAGGTKADTGKATDEPGADKRFTQAELDQHIKTRLERQASKYEGYEDTKSRLVEAERLLKEREVKKSEEAGKYDEALELTKRGHTTDMAAKEAEAAKWRSAYENLTIDQQLMGAAVNGNAVDADDIVLMLRSSVELDAELKPRFSDGKTIADGVKAYLDAKPHLVKAGHRGGGSGTETGGNHQSVTPPNNKPLNQMTRDEIRELGGKGIKARFASQNSTPWSERSNQRQNKD